MWYADQCQPTVITNRFIWNDKDPQRHSHAPDGVCAGRGVHRPSHSEGGLACVPDVTVS